MVEHPEHLDDVFRAVADPTRRAIMRHLAGGERTVTELAAPFDMSLAAVSKHVKVLESAGIITRTVEGRRHVCRLDPESLSEARRWLDHYARFWSDRLAALEAALEADESHYSSDEKLHEP